MAKTSPIDQNTDPSIHPSIREAGRALSVRVTLAPSPPPVMSAAEEKDTAVAAAAGRRKGEGKRNWHRYRKRDRNHDEQELGGEGRR